MKVKCLTRVKINKVIYAPGDLISDIDESQTDRLIKAGAAELISGDKSERKEQEPEHENAGYLHEMNVIALRDLAKERGIEGFNKMKKGELIAALVEADPDGRSD